MMKTCDRLHSQYSELCKNCIPSLLHEFFEGKNEFKNCSDYDSTISVQMVGFHFTSPICRHLLCRHPYLCKISILTLRKRSMQYDSYF